MRRATLDGASSRGGRRRLLMAGVAAAVAATVITGAGAAQQSGIDLSVCANLEALGIPKQTNFRAAMIMAACGAGGAPVGSLTPGMPTGFGAVGGHQAYPRTGPNLNVITGTETLPHVVQSETQQWVHTTTVVVAYNDSRSVAASPVNISGISVSTDGGDTFTRLNPSPFTGLGNNFGDPVVVYNQRLGAWYSAWLASGCGGQGLGLWRSTNATSWTVVGCAHSSSGDDRESMWVDNNPASPFYGRMYISFNNFAVGGGALFVTRSDDGVTWTPVQLTPGFIRDVQINVTSNGTVVLAAMNEGGGGFAARQNILYRSTNGGVTWAAVSMGAPFAPPGDSTCGYFARVNPIWRHMGWGDLATGSGGLIVYSYAADGAGADTGDIYVVRSTDHGATWGAPVRLDGVAANNTQWMPSTAGGAGNFLVTWYDRRNTTNGTNYERMGRQSADGGLTWAPIEVISDTLITQPLVVDPNINTCYCGDYGRTYFDGQLYHDAWTDGRVSIGGNPQQDVFYQRVFKLLPAGGPPIMIDNR